MKNEQGLMIIEQRTLNKDQWSLMNERWRMNKIKDQGRMNDVESTSINDHWTTNDKEWTRINGQWTIKDEQ